MKRLFLLFAMMMALAGTASAQKANFITTVFTNTGRPVAGALVTICNHHSNAPNPCTDTAGIQLYADYEGSVPIANPTPSNGYGNVFVFLANGNYDFSIAGNGIATTTYKGLTLSNAGSVLGVTATAPVTSTGGANPVIACATCVTASGAGTISVVANQIGYATATNQIVGSNNFQYIPGSGGLILTGSNVGPTNVTGAVIALINSLGGGTSYFVKSSTGGFSIRNDSNLIQTLGTLSWDNLGNLQLAAGASGAALNMYVGNSAAPFGQGSVLLNIQDTGTGNHGFAVNNSGSGHAGYVFFDPFNSLLTIAGDTSGTWSLGVNSAAGSPCEWVVPTTSPASAGQSLTSAAASGGKCQLVWINSPIVANLVTTSGTTDNVTITGMTSSGHCTFSPTNASAATNIATSYISNKTTNQITLTHTATASMNFDFACTPY